MFCTWTAAEGATALRQATPYLTWGEQEGEDTLPHGEWLALVLRGARITPEVHGLVFDDNYTSLQATARLWGVYRQNGLVFADVMSPAQVLRAINKSAAKAPYDSLVLAPADFVPTQARPAAPAQAQAPAILGAANMQRPPSFRNLAPFLTYGDLVWPDGKLQAVARLEHTLHRRVRDNSGKLPGLAREGLLKYSWTTRIASTRLTCTVTLLHLRRRSCLRASAHTIATTSGILG